MTLPVAMLLMLEWEVWMKIPVFRVCHCVIELVVGSRWKDCSTSRFRHSMENSCMGKWCVLWRLFVVGSGWPVGMLSQWSSSGDLRRKAV